MEVIPGPAVRVGDSSAVAQARRVVGEQARLLAWDDEAVGRAELVATEIATNLLKHASDGCLGVQRSDDRLQLLAVDRGAGMDIEASLRPGFSTAGTPGNGLPAIQRLSEGFEIYSTAGKGAVLAAELAAVVSPWRAAARPRPACPVGALSMPRAGESVCGDGWSVHQGPRITTLLVCDGLGHGQAAADASVAARLAFERQPESRPAEIMDRLHGALRPTRGAAAAVAWIDRGDSLLRYCGVGNITAVLVHGDRARHLVSHNGILGHVGSRMVEYTQAWEPGDLLVMHSDGLSSRWRAEDYPGLFGRSSALVAGTLYRDAARDRDDATVVVLRLGGQPGRN